MKIFFNYFIFIVLIVVKVLELILYVIFVLLIFFHPFCLFLIIIRHQLLFQTLFIVISLMLTFMWFIALVVKRRLSWTHLWKILSLTDLNNDLAWTVLLWLISWKYWLCILKYPLNRSKFVYLHHLENRLDLDFFFLWWWFIKTNRLNASIRLLPLASLRWA